MDESNLGNPVTGTGKTETCTRKSDDNDSSYNSYETSDSNFIADKKLAKICILFALYNHCAFALQFY